MQQHLLFSSPPQQDYHTWVHHHGTSTACARLTMWLIHGGMLWLKSDTPAGKSHLLHALQEEHPHMGLAHIQQPLPALKQVTAWLEILDQHAYWSVDLPAGKLTHTTAIALFHLIERAKDMHRPLLIAWRCSDHELSPSELASRMRMMEQINIMPPESDNDLRRVLQAAAHQLHWDIPHGLIQVMLTHLPRNLESQINALQHLEAASLEEKARMTQTWARQKLNI